MIAPLNEEAVSCRHFPGPPGSGPSVHSGGKAKCQPESKGPSERSEKDTQPLLKPEGTEREKSGPGGRACGDRTTTSQA